MIRCIAVSLALATIAAGNPNPNPQVASKQKFIENGKIKIGVDLSSGGSIFWFSELPADRNLMNHADRGRFIQQSYYGKTDGSMWAKKPWRWNPVQGGDYKGKAPWKGGPISKDVPGWPNESRKTDEHWAGFVGPDGRGVGVLFPGTDTITTYRHPGPAGPKGGGCSYFAPIRTMSITPGFTFEYSIYLTIGSAEEMRARFKPIAQRQLEEAAKPAAK